MPELLPASRVTVFLPVNTASEQWAAALVARSFRLRFGGATETSFNPPVLTGYWYDDDVLYSDQIAVVFSDLQAEEYNQPDMAVALQAIRDAAFQAYSERGSPQLEIWLTVEPLSVYL